MNRDVLELTNLFLINQKLSFEFSCSEEIFDRLVPILEADSRFQEIEDAEDVFSQSRLFGEFDISDVVTDIDLKKRLVEFLNVIDYHARSLEIEFTCPAVIDPSTSLMFVCDNYVICHVTTINSMGIYFCRSCYDDARFCSYNVYEGDDRTFSFVDFVVDINKRQAELDHLKDVVTRISKEFGQ